MNTPALLAPTSPERRAARPFPGPGRSFPRTAPTPAGRAGCHRAPPASRFPPRPPGRCRPGGAGGPAPAPPRAAGVAPSGRSSPPAARAGASPGRGGGGGGVGGGPGRPGCQGGGSGSGPAQRPRREGRSEEGRRAGGGARRGCPAVTRGRRERGHRSLLTLVRQLIQLRHLERAAPLFQRLPGAGHSGGGDGAGRAAGARAGRGLRQGPGGGARAPLPGQERARPGAKGTAAAGARRDRRAIVKESGWTLHFFQPSCNSLPLARTPFTRETTQSPLQTGFERLQGWGSQSCSG